MISHGFISGAMFLCIGVLYDRMHTREIADYGGVVNTMPKFAALAMLFSMANCGLPGTSGFVGEFMVILAAVHFNFWIAFGAAFTLILAVLALSTLFMGIYPKPFTDVMHVSVDNLLTHVAQSKLPDSP
jgi:NADH-quinone oxidoreductase subunit M